jgi:hypothetical protein
MAPGLPPTEIMRHNSACFTVPLSVSNAFATLAINDPKTWDNSGAWNVSIKHYRNVPQPIVARHSGKFLDVYGWSTAERCQRLAVELPWRGQPAIPAKPLTQIHPAPFVGPCFLGTGPHDPLGMPRKRDKTAGSHGSPPGSSPSSAQATASGNATLTTRRPSARGSPARQRGYEVRSC